MKRLSPLFLAILLFAAVLIGCNRPIDTLDGGALVVNGKPIPVADAYRAALNKRMNIL